jgi:hypothetical protein
LIAFVTLAIRRLRSRASRCTSPGIVAAKRDPAVRHVAQLIEARLARRRRRVNLPA